MQLINCFFPHNKLEPSLQYYYIPIQAFIIFFIIGFKDVLLVKFNPYCSLVIVN